MSLTSYQTALPRNRGLGLYAKWPAFALIAEEERVTLFKRLDLGWLYLLCGLVLTSSAIVLPAHHDFDELNKKCIAMQNNVDELHYQIEIYKQFLFDLTEETPQLKKRILAMQLNIQKSGTPVVTDTSASKTPLEWINQRVRRSKEFSLELQQTSILSHLATGRSRLLLIGVGVFAMFIGFVSSKKAQ